jgi:hypothetical protein
VIITLMDEGQHAFISLVLDRYRAGENQEWVTRNVQWGLKHRGDLFPFPLLGQNAARGQQPPAAVEEPRDPASAPPGEPRETTMAQPERPPVLPQSAYCLPDWEDMDLDPTEEAISVHRSPAQTQHLAPAYIVHNSPVYSTVHSSPETCAIPGQHTDTTTCEALRYTPSHSPQ